MHDRLVPVRKTPGRQTAPETVQHPAWSRLAGSHSVMPARQSWVSARDGGISVSLARHDRTTVTRRKWLMEKTAEMEYGQAVRRKQVRRVARI